MQPKLCLVPCTRHRRGCGLLVVRASFLWHVIGRARPWSCEGQLMRDSTVIVPWLL